MNIGPYTFTLRMILIALGIAFVAFMLLLGPSQCAKRKTAEKQAEVSANQGSAGLNAAQEAGNTTSSVIANATATDEAVARGSAEVRAAAKGEKGKAAQKAACRFKAYADTPQCKGVK